MGIPDAGWEDKILAVTAAPDCDPVWCNTFIEVRYRDGTAEDGDPLLRSQLVHAGAPIRKGGVHGGYIWLEDEGGQIWRYALDEAEATKAFATRARIARSTGFRPPFVCDMIDECRESVAGEEPEAR